MLGQQIPLIIRDNHHGKGGRAGGTLSVTEEKKKKDWSWSILVVGYIFHIVVGKFSDFFFPHFRLDQSSPPLPFLLRGV